MENRRWRSLRRDGVLLSWLDVAGPEPAVLLLHGLAGLADEWEPTIEALAGEHRFIALDQRGHGSSERDPADVSRTAFVDDAAEVIRNATDGRVAVIGQSLGAHTAMLLASRHPELVCSVVSVEASCEPDPASREATRQALSDWPIPFESREAAVNYFGGEHAGHVWAAGLEPREDGLHPWFDAPTLIRALDETASRSFCDEWETVDCPVLHVAGETGQITAQRVDRLREITPRAEFRVVEAAGHDVHLDAPAAWCDVLASWLRTTTAA